MTQEWWRSEADELYLLFKARIFGLVSKAEERGRKEALTEYRKKLAKINEETLKRCGGTIDIYFVFKILDEMLNAKDP